MERKYGKWLPVEELGRGGQGAVYRAIDVGKENEWISQLQQGLRDLGGVVHVGNQQRPAARKIIGVIREYLTEDSDAYGALKILHQEGAAGDRTGKAQSRFGEEIQTLSKVEHPNLIPVLDYDENMEWAVFRYYQLGALQNDMGRFKGRPLKAARALLGVAGAVKLLHSKGYVHRDIKPGNIFLGNDGKLVLGDFGLVYDTDRDKPRITATREKAGTTDWMPTWAIGSMRQDEVRPSFDVFTLAKLLWALIAGGAILRLHYFDREEFDLTKRFPKNPGMSVVNDVVLRCCLVEEEKSCLKDADSFHSRLQRLIQRLKAEEERLCRICGIGRYVGDVGASVQGKYELHCSQCGHIETFRADSPFELPRWVQILRTDPGVLR